MGFDAPSHTTARMSYTPSELMAAVAARELRDSEVVFVGIGLPASPATSPARPMLPDLVLIYESGADRSGARTVAGKHR